MSEAVDPVLHLALGLFLVLAVALANLAGKRVGITLDKGDPYKFSVANPNYKAQGGTEKEVDFGLDEALTA